MSLSAGTRLGRYEILGPLGAGGMGEVYRARDSRLGREVAIKVLPEAVARDAARLRRFEKEARAAGSLNHPNILDVHDIGTHEGAPYLVCELLEGETLRGRLHAGALPVREAIGYAVQIARGLGGAHAKGIVHRDLKPDNLFLAEDGLVKVLDFGLAKLTRAEPSILSSDDTVTSDPSTNSGAVVGTVGYMSPEQIRGQAVDHRADIFAFGAVLYEMLSGRRAFHADTPADTLSAILKEDPRELTSESGEVPLGLARIAHRCLEKRPERRFQSAEDLAFALEAVSDVPTATPRSEERWRRLRLLLASLGALVALGVGGAVWRVVSRGAPSKLVPAARVVPLTSLPGREVTPALSPDGSRVAFSWEGETGDNWDIYVKQIGTETLLRLTRDRAVDSGPVWSPDGGQIAFFRRTERERAFFIVPALGGPERRVFAIPGAKPRAGFADWQPDGLDWSPEAPSLALEDSPADGPMRILLLSIESLETTPLASLAGRTGVFAFSPDGRRLAFVERSATSTQDNDIYIVPVSGGEPRRLTFDSSWVGGLDWTGDGREIVFSSGRAGPFGGLWRVSASGGDPGLVTPGGEGAEGGVSIARGAPRLAYTRAGGDSNIWRVEVNESARHRGRSAPVAASTAWESEPQFSPDGGRIVLASGRSGQPEIWSCQADGSTCVQLSSCGGPSCGAPRWSPDGGEVAFDGRPEGNWDIFSVDVETRVTRQLVPDPSDDVQPSWSRDGRWIYFGSNRTGSWQVWKVPVAGGQAVQVTTGGGFRARESSDGAFLFFSRGYWSSEIWRKPLEGGQETRMVTVPEGLYWEVGEHGLYYLNPEAQPRPTIELFDPLTGEVTSVTELQGGPNLGEGLAVSPDGRSILYVQVDTAEQDLMLIEDFR